MDYKAGDIIEYETFCDTPRVVKIIERCSDIKNGRPGFDGEVIEGKEKGMSVWGYDSQIIRIDRRF